MTIRNVSASQVGLYERCNRWWWWERIAGHRGPPSEAMLRGSAIHKAIENYLLHGQISDDEYAKFVVAVKPHLPALDQNVLVEKKVVIPTGFDGIPWIGFIDLLEHERNPRRVSDYKTTSDFRYAKTPHELSTNTQLISYAKYCYDEGHTGPLEIGHLYIHTRRKTPQVKPVYVEVNQDHVESEWQKRLVTVGDMIQSATVTDGESITPNPASCGMYGGCPHRARCGFSAKALFKQLAPKEKTKEKGKEKMGSFMDKLKAANAKAVKTKTNGQSGAPAPVTAQPATVPGNTGVVPPDAPARTTDAAEAQAIQEQAAAKSKRGRKKQTPAQKAAKKAEKARLALQKAEEEAAALAAEENNPVQDAAPAPAPAAAPAPAPAAPAAAPAPAAAAPAAAAPAAAAPTAADVLAAAGLTLYVDCLPTKGPNRNDFTLFEDWYMGIATKIAEDADLIDYRLLPYAEEKAALTQAIITAHSDHNLPSVIVVNSASMGAKDALSVLTPFADQIVKAMR